MAIDTKTTASGVVILFLSGTGGYLATNAINGESNTPTTSLEGGQTRSGNPEEGQPTLETREEQEGVVTSETATETAQSDDSARNSAPERTPEESRSQAEGSITPSQKSEITAGTEDQSRSAETGTAQENPQTHSSSEKVDTASDQGTTNLAPTAPEVKEDLSKIMKEKMTSDLLEDIEEDEPDCKEALNKSFDSANYKVAVKACYKKLTLKKRAEKLGIELLEITGQENNNKWKERFNSLSDSAYQMAQSSAASITWNGSKTDDNTNITNLKAFCSAVEELTLEKIITNEKKLTLENEWTNFLKGCAKSSTENKSFWTLSEVKE